MKNIKIVIDADIARSAGLSEHPVSRSSRNTLDNIQKNSHQAVFCRKLLAEWKLHRSNYSQTWLSTMIAKKQFEIVATEDPLSDAISESTLTEPEKEISTKDVHLVENALLSDNFIISNDDRARNTFIKLSEEIKKIKAISWVNSTSNNDTLCEYLAKKSRPIKEWKL